MKIERVVTGYLEENCYILTMDKESLVIDPGDDYDLIKEKLKDTRVLAVLLTHNHFDHVGALNDVVNDYNIKVYSANNLEEKEYKFHNFIFRVISTPGHSSDSVTFYFEKEKLMFTGDFIFKGNIGRCDLPTGSWSSMQKSLKKIKEYSSDITIYPGHGDKTTLMEEENNNQYLFTN